MRHTIYTGTLLTALFLLGSGVPGLAMESQPNNDSRPVQNDEMILDVDENRIFELNRASVHSLKPTAVSEGKTEDANTVPSPVTGQKEKTLVEVDHDFNLHP